MDVYVASMSALLVQPYALHATFQFAGTPGKRHRMREFMLFDDPPEYYDHKVGFISFQVSKARQEGGRHRCCTTVDVVHTCRAEVGSSAMLPHGG
jgi:hypothetical protein